MKLVLPVAGLGTRLQPVTYSTHKSLLPIGEKVIMQHLVDLVRETQHLDLSEIIFITGKHRQQIEEWARKTYTDIPLRFIDQHITNGSADAIRLAEKHVQEDMLIIFPDALIDTDLEVVAELRETVDGIIWTAEVDHPERFGVVETDEEGYMMRLEEKPEEPKTNLVNIGMYYIKDYKSAFSMISALYEREIQAKGEYNFPEALDLMARNGKKIRSIQVEGWYDCGTRENILRTNKLFTERMGIESNSTIHPGAVIENSTLFNCIVLENARIHDSDLSNSIIGPKSIIKKFSGTLFVGSNSHIQGNK